jgi:hypothetical protein
MVSELPLLSMSALQRGQRYNRATRQMLAYTGRVPRKFLRDAMHEPIPKRFVNAQFWQTSPYLNSVMAAFFLSTLVSIVEFAQQDIRTLLQDWLNLVDYLSAES